MEKNIIEEFLLMVALEGKSYADVALELGVQRSQLTTWEKDFKHRYTLLAHVRKIFNRKKVHGITYREFLEWYENTNRKCYYCKITESEIQELIDANQIYTKRLTTRGRKLEIERRIPNKDYFELDNLVYCCYWCNNAKSDEFSETEFNYIGQVIGVVFSNRLRGARERKQNAKQEEGISLEELDTKEDYQAKAYQKHLSSKTDAQVNDSENDSGS